MRTLLLYLFLALISFKAVNAQVDTGKIFFSVENFPEPRSRWQEFYQFLGANIEFPEPDMKEGSQGKVIIEFVVEMDSSLTNITTSPAEGMNATPAMLKEAKRVIKLSPKWKPGTLYGEPVRAKYSIPVELRLTETKKMKRLRQKRNR